jgi:hypothetical protein
MKKTSHYILGSALIVLFLIPFGIVFNGIKEGFKKNTVESAGVCTIISAQWNPSGNQGDTFYAIGTTIANIIIKTKDCVGQTILLSIAESDYAGDDYWNDSGIYERAIIVPTDNFTSKIKLGEEDCEVGGSIDCELYFELSHDTQKYNSYDQSGGVLFYECSGVCEDDGAYLETIPNGTDTVPLNINQQTPLNEPNDMYKLLAPIAGLTEAPSNIGDYFSKIFLLAIGLCGALAVIMIIISGVQYMGNDSIFGKTEAKSKILASVLGLLIALGSYALLNTINPDLLGGGGVNIAQVTADVTEPPLSQESKNIQYGTTVGTCTEGLEPVAVNGTVIMNVCGKTMADNVRLMIYAAKTVSPYITLTGNAYRSYADQVQARIDNGCVDIYKKSKCNTPTAVPGTSLHESGKAIDFMCNGAGQFINVTTGPTANLRPATQVCWDWMVANASKYGLYNYPKENWHWSTTGN